MGQKNCTFNMHLHLHLKQMLLDFGPANATCCYAFEKFIGFLGSYYTNHKAIEPQIMQQFSQHHRIYATPIPYLELNSIWEKVPIDAMSIESDGEGDTIVRHQPKWRSESM